MIEPQAQASGIHVILPAFSDPHFVMADRTRVKQAIVNLLSNAIKYNHAGGTVEMTFTELSPKRIRISFRDTGEGLSAENLAQAIKI